MRFQRPTSELCLSLLMLLACVTRTTAGTPQNRRTDDLLAEAENATRSGHFDIAEADYRKLVAVEPASARLWSNLGAVRAMSGNCTAALPALDRARALDSKLYTPWYFGGFCHLQLHQEKAALAELSRAVALNSRDANAWLLRARAAANLEQLGVAFSSAVRGLKADAVKPELYYLAGRVALDLAAECYSRVMAAPNATALALELDGERDAGQGLRERAISALRKALALAPDSPSLHFSLGWVYFEERRSSDAEPEWRRCLELSPESAWAKLRLALVLAQEGKSAEAASLAAGLDPGSFESREEFDDFLALSAAMKNSQWGERALARGLALFPGDAGLEAWTRPGAFSSDLSQEGKRSSATSLPGLPWQSADKTCLPVRFYAISSHELGSGPPTGLLAGTFPTAEEYARFRSAFLRDDFATVGELVAPKLGALPENAQGAFVLGQLLHWLSFEYDQRLESSYSDSEAAQILMAENLTEFSQPEKAAAIFQALIAKDGDSPDLLRGLARVYWTQSRWDEALEVLGRVLQADPGDATTMVNIGRIYSYRQDLANARHNFARALKADPNSFEAHLGLGETYHREGSATDALRELRIAEQLDPANPRPHYILAQLYRKLGEPSSADREMAQFQRLQSEIAAAKTHKTEELVPVD
jgi:tetratricopeptide (TPR) repeat protein